MTTIDPLHSGPRNEYMQALQSKYTEICRQEGLEARPSIVQALANLDQKGVAIGLEAIAGTVAMNGHRVAARVLDSPEFRPLVSWWVGRFPNDKQDGAASQLENIGALYYQRAVREGGR
jgi:hypothetical protein